VQDGGLKNIVNRVKEDSPGVLPGVDAYSGGTSRLSLTGIWSALRIH
jgi:hypothetical protein